MKHLRKFPDTETRDEVLAATVYDILSYTINTGIKIKIGEPGPGPEPGPEPDVPTDRIILKFMVTEGDWNEDAEKYKKQLVGENCGAIAYDGGCFKYMIKDDEDIFKNFWSQFIYFDTLGEHTVELIFNEEFDGNLPYGCLSRCNMHEAIISSNVISIGGQAFIGCSGLTSVTIPNSVTTIGDQAFQGCYELTSVTIPNSVTSIGNGAFQGCYELTSVTIPNSVTTIDDNTFNGCSSLTSVTIPEGVTKIGYAAFQGCSGLTSVTIPEGVTSIGSYAFNDCSSLTSVTIPEGVTSINYAAFNSCHGLTSITCNAINPPSIGGGVFSATNDCPIYVPASSVDAYKAATRWSEYASRIQAIQ